VNAKAIEAGSDAVQAAVGLPSGARSGDR